MKPDPPVVVLDPEARTFLRRTGVFVIVIEIVVLAAIWWFQRTFGR